MLNTDKIIKDIKLLKKSISKWSKVAFENVEENGPNDCACCQEYLVNKTYTPCKDCPIKLLSNHRYCQNTPYDIWADFEEERLGRNLDINSFHLEERQRLAENELNFLIFLKDLLEKFLITKSDPNTKEYDFYKKYKN